MTIVCIYQISNSDAIGAMDAPMDEDEADDFANKLYRAIEWKLPDELKKEE